METMFFTEEGKTRGKGKGALVDWPRGHLFGIILVFLDDDESLMPSTVL